MTRSFSAGSSNYLENAAVPVGVTPLTMACWFQTTNAAASNRYLVTLGASGNDTNLFALVAGAANFSIAIAAGGTTGFTTCLTALSSNVWYHGCGVFASSTSRSAYLNGGAKATTVTNRTPASLNRTWVARRQSGVYWDGLIAEVAIWSDALSDAEAAVLATGVSPLLVRPASLVAYWPLGGRNSPETDRVGAFDLSVTGASFAVQPRTVNPTRSRRIYVPAAGGVSVPVCCYHYRQQGIG